MVNTYKTILKEAQIEYVIEKSKFIGYIKPVKEEKEAIEFIEKIKHMHKTANHNVPVYIIGSKDEIQRYSDDGEPSGTAGVPVLEMLKKEEIKNLVIVMTRYFGGIKLGTGGLVRAYTATAKLALKEAKVIKKVLHDEIKIQIDYSFLGKVQNELFNQGVIIKDTVFDDHVNLYIYSMTQKSEEIIKSIQNLTNAKAKTSIENTLYLNEIDGKIKLD